MQHWIGGNQANGVPGGEGFERSRSSSASGDSRSSKRKRIASGGRSRRMQLHQFFGETSRTADAAAAAEEDLLAGSRASTAPYPAPAPAEQSKAAETAYSIVEDEQLQRERGSSSTPAPTALPTTIIAAGSSSTVVAFPPPLSKERETREAMSPALWSTLPDHLLDGILARLPVQSFFRFRTVCKAWNTHMYSGGFLEAYAGTPSQGPWFFFFTHDERNYVSTFNSASKKWHKLPLCPPHSNTNPYSAADGGLVCYFSYENGSKSIVVCNPLTKCYRRLPPLLKGQTRVAMLAMVFDRVRKSYKVVVTGVLKGGVGQVQNTEVYDSQTESWTSSEIPATHTLKGKPVFSQGFLYVRSQSQNQQQRNLLLAYDLDQGVWSDLHEPLPSTVRRGELLEWQGRILMVGELQENNKVHSICIWEQDQSVGSLKWKEVDRLPAGLFEGCFGDIAYFQCSEKDDVILDWCQAGRFVLLFAYNLYDVRGRCKLLVYDLAKKSWQRLQNFSCYEVCGTGRIVRGIFHEPRLDARA